MKSLTRAALMGLMLTSTAVSAQTVEGPEVNWSLSMWGNPRALSAGMEAISAEIADQTGGNFNIEVDIQGKRRIIRAAHGHSRARN